MSASSSGGVGPPLEDTSYSYIWAGKILFYPWPGVGKADTTAMAVKATSRGEICMARGFCFWKLLVTSTLVFMLPGLRRLARPFLVSADHRLAVRRRAPWISLAAYTLARMCMAVRKCPNHCSRLSSYSDLMVTIICFVDLWPLRVLFIGSFFVWDTCILPYSHLEMFVILLMCQHSFPTPLCMVAL